MTFKRGPDGKFVGKGKKAKIEVIEEPGEIRTLKQTIKDLKKRNDRLQSGAALIIDAVREAYEDPVDFYIPAMPKASKKKAEETAVLHLSDLHIGKITSSYDSAVASERVNRLIEKVIRITNVRRSAAAIESIHIYVGGDIIEGEEIFPHQAHLIDQSVFEQAVRTAPAIMCRAITTLLKEFRYVKISCVAGNHGRNGPKGTRAHPRTNWDTVCYEVMKMGLLGINGKRAETKDRVTIDISDEFYIVDRVYDWGNLIVHGHEIRGGFAGFPWYGCVPSDHEVLTKSGWKHHADLTIGEPVMTFDHETHENRWEPVENISTFDIEDTIYKMSRPDNQEMFFTKDHKWPTEIPDTPSRRSLTAANNINADHWLPTHGQFQGKESILSDRHAAILGWIVTDGTLRRKIFKGEEYLEAIIYQSERKFLTEVEELTGSKAQILRSDKKDDIRAVNVKINDLREILEFYSGKESLPKVVGGLSRSAAESMFNVMIKAEGSIKSNSTSFCQIPGPVSEAFEMLSIMVGQTAWTNIDKEGFARVIPREHQYIRPTWGQGLQEVEYKGTVWCPTTPSGTWWVRSPSGMIMPTGNTAKKAWGWIDAIPEYWDYLWFGHFHTYASAVLNYRVFLANGTLESDNDHARANFSAAGFPCQRLCFFNAKHGLTSDNQVYLTEGTERLPSRLRSGK